MDHFIQEIYINLDDSGKLSQKENLCVYGGLVFLSKKEKDKFITQYRKIVNEIKCGYCHHLTCDKKCPEIKNTNILAKDKRWLMNYIKKYYIVALVIKNDCVYEHIKNDKAAKGRFVDYSIRRMIKEVVKTLIFKKKINPQQSLKIIINIDQQSTKSNGYYNLKDGLVEELKYGIVNYNYASHISPIIMGDLKILVTYQNSLKSYVVQAADLLAGTIRRKMLETNGFDSFVDFNIIVP